MAEKVPEVATAPTQYKPGVSVTLVAETDFRPVLLIVIDPESQVKPAVIAPRQADKEYGSVLCNDASVASEKIKQPKV